MLELAFPDWAPHDTVLRARRPFALWQVGDQPLLYHWLDHAINTRQTKLRLFVVDRPDAVRRAMRDATLWPVDWEVVPVSSIAHSSAARATRVTGLPGTNDPDFEPRRNGWSLVDHWFALEESWFASAFAGAPVDDVNLAIGRGCSIHPTAKLTMPVYIGDHAVIGPRCEIGPFASVGAGSMLAGDNIVRRSKIAARTLLASQTELDRCYLEGGLLLNLRHRGLVPKIDPVVADGWTDEKPRVPLTERVTALFYWAALQLRTIFASHGHDDDIWKQRIPWLLDAAAGRRFLYGVLPRGAAQMAALSDDWRQILEHAPTGVFSYADALGCHSTSDPMEPVHAVYQATTSAPAIRDACRRFARETLREALAITPPVPLDAHDPLTDRPEHANS